MKKLSSLLILISLCANAFAVMPDSSDFSLNLGMNNVGVCIGNAPRHTGIRINWSDHNVKRINGINITLWEAGKNPDAEITGMALGLVGPSAKKISGFSFGLGVGADQIQGVSLGILGLGGDSVRGVGIGGLGLGGDRLEGFFIGGLGFGGNVIRGVGFAGLGLGGDDLKGVFLAGLAMGGDKVSGFSAALLAVGGDQLNGFSGSGLALGGDQLKGVFLTGGYLKAKSLKWVGAAAVVKTKQQTGLTIALFNFTRKLNGIQLGGLNYAENNPWPFKVVPFMNCHF